MGLESGHLIWMGSCSADVMRPRTRKAMLEDLISNTFRRLHSALPAFWLRQMTTLPCSWTRQWLKVYIHTASKTEFECTINVSLWGASDFCHCSMALTFSAIGTRQSCSCHYARAQAKPFNKTPLAIDGHSRPKMRPFSSRAPDASAASAASTSSASSALPARIVSSSCSCARHPEMLQLRLQLLNLSRQLQILSLPFFHY